MDASHGLKAAAAVRRDHPGPPRVSVIAPPRRFGPELIPFICGSKASDRYYRFLRRSAAFLKSKAPPALCTAVNSHWVRHKQPSEASDSGWVGLAAARRATTSVSFVRWLSTSGPHANGVLEGCGVVWGGGPAAPSGPRCERLATCWAVSQEGLIFDPWAAVLSGAAFGPHAPEPTQRRRHQSVTQQQKQTRNVSSAGREEKNV